MKNILVLLILFTSLVSWGQRVNIDELTVSDDIYSFQGNVYNGSVYVLYDSGQLKEGFKVKNGKIEGKMTFYRDDSFVKERYKDTTLIKQLEDEVITLNDELISLKKDSSGYYNRKRSLKSEMGDKFYKYKEKYNEGKLKGSKLELYEDYLHNTKKLEEKTSEVGEKRIERNKEEQKLNTEKNKSEYSHKKKNGYLYKNGSCYYHAEYDKNEKLVLEEELKDGVKNGSFKSYNGDVIVEEGTYSNGLMTGAWIFRHENGNLKGQGNYVNGDMGEKDKTGIPKKGREGNWVLYHENGNISKERNYTNGLLTGIDKAYYKSGKIWYINNNVPEGSTSLPDGVFNSYYENGNLEEKSFWKMGRRHGKTILFYENGNTKESGNYIEFKRDSLQLFYYENGELEEKSFWTMGKRNGKYKSYYKNGNIKEEITYRNGNVRFNGNIHIKYNPDGSVADFEDLDIPHILEFLDEGIYGGQSPGWYVYKDESEKNRLIEQHKEELKSKERKNNSTYQCVWCGRDFTYKTGSPRSELFDYLGRCEVVPWSSEENSYCSDKCSIERCKNKFGLD